MPASKANQRAVNKYKKNNYDRIEITVPKGQREVFQAHAAANSESVNGFITRAISEAMERDNSGAAAPESVQQETGTVPAGRVVYRVPAGIASEIAQQGPEGPSGAGVVSFSETMEAAQRAAKRTGETLTAFLARAVADQEKRDDRSFQMGINPA